jgi:hypothetical protein
VLAAGEHAQHPRRVVSIAGLPQNLVSHHHNRIGPKHKVSRSLTEDGQRFFPRQPFRASLGQLADEGCFMHIGGLHHEGDAGIAKKFLAAWGSGR